MDLDKTPNMYFKKNNYKISVKQIDDLVSISMNKLDKNNLSYIFEIEIKDQTSLKFDKKIDEFYEHLETNDIERLFFYLGDGKNTIAFHFHSNDISGRVYSENSEWLIDTYRIINNQLEQIEDEENNDKIVTIIKKLPFIISLISTIVIGIGSTEIINFIFDYTTISAIINVIVTITIFYSSFNYIKKILDEKIEEKYGSNNLIHIVLETEKNENKKDSNLENKKSILSTIYSFIKIIIKILIYPVVIGLIIEGIKIGIMLYLNINL